ncbi:aspartokinase, partial [Toxoplasma gondii p89]
GLPAVALDAWDVGMKTSTGSGSSQSLRGVAEVLPSSYEAIGEFFAPLSTSYSYIPVVTGFIAKDKHGRVTTLGRSGSDFTAAVVGAAVRASEVQIWTDVDGLLTADPRVVKGARSVETISFDQASELAYFGAKVIHPKTMLPAMKHNIPVRVKNSYNPGHPGTRIVQAVPSAGVPAHPTAASDGVTAVTYQRDITVIEVNSTRMLGAHGFLARLFSICDQLDISIDVGRPEKQSMASLGNPILWTYTAWRERRSALLCWLLPRPATYRLRRQQSCLKNPEQPALVLQSGVLPSREFPNICSSFDLRLKWRDKNSENGRW